MVGIDKADEYLTQMVCEHEIWHDTYHRELANGEELKEFELFRMQSPTEQEMIRLGYNLHLSISPQSDFFKNITV